VPFILLIAFILSAGYGVVVLGFTIGIAMTIMPFALAFVYFSFMNERVAIIALFIINYFLLGIGRYIQGIPIGLVMDFLLILILASLFFKSFFKEVPWENAWNELFILAVIWYAYIIFQLVNPTAETRVTWFSAMRGLGLYMLLSVPIIYVAYNKNKDLKTFIHIWAVVSILASLKGIIQKHVGLDPWEDAWLDGPQAATHILFGKLRVFSFMSDAGQFGAAQGHSAVVFLILAASQKSTRLRLFYAITGLLAVYGLMISGTRGAMAVPIMGLAIYTVLNGNIKVLVAGAVLGIMVIGFFKYTTIGNGVYAINRMRTAFNPEDASLQVRLENQRKLKAYMASRPFGAGLGSTSEEAKLLAPHSMAAIIPTDSWYVRIWVEMGVVGLTLHLFILFYVVFKGGYIIAFKLKDPWLKTQMLALISGMFGIIVASYGNEILAQMPTGLIMYSSMAYLLSADKLDKEILLEQREYELANTIA
jgi:hypothetical protein